MSNVAKLALEDGTVFTGTAFGATGEVDGEVCFNTSMTGYQEILTDPSYRGQIVTMTYPQIGNYGVNEEDLKALKPHLAGFVVRRVERSRQQFPCNRRSRRLSQALQHPGIAGIDTRALVRKLRTAGAMKGVLSSTDLDDARLAAKAKASPGLVGRDLVREVMPSQPSEWKGELSEWMKLGHTHERAADETSWPHVVALDYGMKWNIPRYLRDQGFRVTVMPGTRQCVGRARRRIPTACFSPTAPVTRNRSSTRSKRSRACWARSRSSASAWATNCFRSPAARRTFKLEVRPPRREPAGDEPRRRASSKSRRRTTASRSKKRRCRPIWK